MGSVPFVITTEFLKTMIEEYLHKKVQKLKFSASNATKNGDNYCSEIKRITISYLLENKQEEEELSVIAKYTPENVYMSKFLNEMKFFDSEITFYNIVLPKLLNFDYREKVAPCLYYYSMNPSPVIIIEDLLPLNYVLLSRKDGLNLGQCLLSVEKLAYFHAASVALQEKDPKIFKQFNKSIFRTQEMKDLVNISYDKVVETCAVIPELHQYVDKLKNGRIKILNRVFDVHSIESKFKVLNHGDFWTNNILFYCNSEETLQDLAFVDFQVSCFSSPCLDLHYFLATSAKMEVKKMYNVVLDHYFESVTKYLGKIHAKTLPKRKDFTEDFRITAYFGLGASMLCVPLIKSFHSENSDLDNFKREDGEGSFRHHCFNNELYRSELLHFLPFYDMLGIFD